MDDKKREELQELIRSGAGVEETFATLDAEHQEAAANTKALANERRKLLQKLEAIAAAKKELADAAKEKPKAESKSNATKESDKPKAGSKTDEPPKAKSESRPKGK